MKVVVIGIDSATFDLILPWVNEGHLPSFRKMIENGVYGKLTSTIPPLTPPAWSSFITGKNPGKHGVYNFFEYGMVPVQSNSIRGETLWSLLNKRNKKIIALNVPMTYPPPKVSGIIVSDILSPYLCTYPKSFKKELLKLFPDYRIATYTSYQEDNEEVYLKEALELLKMCSDLTLYLMQYYAWDFFVSVFYYIDQIQHFFWKYMDSTHPRHNPDKAREYGDSVLKAYRIVDEAIGKVLKLIGKDVPLIVMSDHGAGPLYKNLFINNYLKELGLLKPRKGLSKADLMQRLGFTRENISRFLREMRLSNLLLQRIPTSFLNKFRVVIPQDESPAFFLSINWPRTKAYSLGFGQIFVNLKGKQPFGIVNPGIEYESLVSYLVQKLYELRDPENGEYLIGKVFTKEEIYHGPYMDNAPDLLFIMKRMTYAPSSTIGTRRLTGPPANKYSGDHRINGILMMHGEGINREFSMQNCNIVDLAPTILYLMNVAIPADMDGRVLIEAFDSAYLKSNPIKYANTLKEEPSEQVYTPQKEEIRKRLQSLGYL